MYRVDYAREMVLYPRHAALWVDRWTIVMSVAVYTVKGGMERTLRRD